LVEESPRAIALRKRNWKYIEFNETKENQRISELYDLKKDPSETLNLINKYPIIAENLKQELESVKNSNQEIH
jgi:arylsulfatase A-like enzyme